MQSYIQSLFRHRLMRYLFIGGASYLIELLVLLSLANILSFDATIAVAYSFWVGLAASFFLQKNFAFQNKDNTRSTVGKQALQYGLLVGFNYIFTIFFVALTAHIIGLVPSRTLALLLTTVWNFVIYSRIIFKPITP